MILRGLVLLCPPPSLDTAAFSRLTLKWKVWSSGGWYYCAPPHPLDAAVVSRFDEGVEGMIIRGLVLLCPLPLS